TTPPTSLSTLSLHDALPILPTLGELDLHLFGEGNHRDLWKVFGAHPRRVEGVDGVSFAVWAPNARRVSVVGDFCRWDGRLFPMRSEEHTSELQSRSDLVCRL